ncbi:DNA mismatch repair protein MutS [Streptococcus moroccensis]|uniref:DNA mismatch repair protein MutS n=1 Tax=Streptococcus moroccensis TaxID=1451356 RepID=A0ABT9YSC4_9STRE|nr:DNA mismatch repair protein MutS [Streptococcus moroccensis]MDQ0222619.1 DNA mismatch repair protein MutS [Streptococcus moroccensis]
MTTEKLSPGMQQYLDIKADYPDAFLLFRMGDFYELFYDDAVEAAQILELTLTSRNKNAENPIPMAGVPYHSAQTYIDTLVELGHKVAIAEQMEDPKTAVGVVKRAVVQVITPGTVADSSKLDSDNNFLIALDQAGSTYGLAYMDVVTGDFYVTEMADLASATGEIRNLRAREVVLGFELDEETQQVLSGQMNLLLSPQKDALIESPLIDQHLTVLEKQVAGKLLAYVARTQLRELSHLKSVRPYQVRDVLQMDYATKSSLDLLENARTGKKHGSLFWLMDETKTAMGMRLLRAWLDRPLIDRQQIEYRQAVIQVLMDAFIERADLVEALKGVYDIERLASRVSFGKSTPKDLLQLGQTLGHVPAIRTILEGLGQPVLDQLVDRLDALPELHALITAAIDPDVPTVITEGGIIKTGFDETLDKYRVIMRDGAAWIAELEAKEREATGITNLKIDYNRKDGYYFHVTNSQLGHVPSHFFRKATLKNSERYGTEALTSLERDILEAREQSASLEYEIFMRLRQEVAKYIQRLQDLAQAIATVDVLQSLAEVAEQQHLVKPTFTDSRVIDIVNGRHAVVEKVMGAQSYVPNHIQMDETTALQLITGPNMSGKSTYMRQLAIIVILAQIGSYVPAETATLPIFDAIFTRIGAADDLVSGQSTFMVEMMEANKAIRLATENSLILFDELGRGTATYDGMALAQAIIEYIHDKVGAKTLFATHYHELTSLSDQLEHLVNVHVATLEKSGQVTFLHKIAQGPADKSYGIHVAKIAGLPDNLLARADHILTQLEQHAAQIAVHQDGGFGTVQDPPAQLDLFTAVEDHPVLTRLSQINLNTMTPMEAMMALAELQKEL